MVAITNAETVTADLRRVVDGLTKVVALLDEAAEQSDDVMDLRDELTAAHQLLDQVRSIVDYAGDAAGGGSGTGDGVAVPVAVLVAAAGGFVAAGLGDRPWWVYGLVGTGAFGVFAVAFALRGAVVRRRADRSQLRRTDLATLIPADYVEDDATPAADLNPSPVAKVHAHLLMSGPASRTPTWLTRVRLGQAAAALAGVPKTSRVPLLATAPAMPAVKRLVTDVDALVSDLHRRRTGRRRAEHAIAHYGRARSGLVCAYRLMSDTTDRLTAYGRSLDPDLGDCRARPR